MDSPPSITSVDNPRIKAALKLRKQRERRRSGLFIAEGLREIERAHEAGLTIREVYCCKSMLESADSKLVHSGQRFEVSERVMHKLAYRENPEGWIAVVEQPNWQLETLRVAEDEDDKNGGPPLVLVAVGVSKPGNLGAMARSAEAAGCDAMLVVDGVVDGFNPNAIRASTGAVFSLPVLATSTDEALAWLKREGLRVIAADAVDASDKPAQPHWAAAMAGPVAIVIGAEDTGLSDAWRRAAATITRIEMAGQVVDSLNASVAAAVMLFEAARQRV